MRDIFYTSNDVCDNKRIFEEAKNIGCVVSMSARF